MIDNNEDDNAHGDKAREERNDKGETRKGNTGTHA